MLLVSPGVPVRSGCSGEAPDAALPHVIVFDCAGLPATEFAELSRHVRLFTETAGLREAVLPPTLEDSRLWERLSPVSSRKVS